MEFSRLRVAIVQDTLVSPGGAERVLLALLELFPKAEIFTVIFNPLAFSSWPFCKILEHKIHTSFIQHIPFSKRFYRYLFKLWPLAIESFNFDGFDLVISSHYLGAMGVIVPPNIPHIAYVHSPARYFYSHKSEYERDFVKKGFLGWIKSIFWIPWSVNYRMWDAIASKRPDIMLANSTAVAKRIKKYYKRKAHVLYPPVDVKKIFSKIKKPVDFSKRKYYLFVSRLVPYKRADVVVSAFLKLQDKKLLVVGDGPQLKELQKIAEGMENIRFLGFVKEARLYRLYKYAKALIFPAYEDFGIVPIEAMAAGTPVIAYARGGAEDYIVEGKNGWFFFEQTSNAVISAIEKFESQSVAWIPDEIQRFSLGFSKEVFQKNFAEIVQKVL